MIYVYTDGASRGNPGKGAAAFVLVRGKEIIDQQALFLGYCTNNEAEYNAVIEGLKRASVYEKNEVLVRSDSKLVINQLLGLWQVKNYRMKLLRDKALGFTKVFDKVSFEHVPRTDPWVSRADYMCNSLLDSVETQQRT